MKPKGTTVTLMREFDIGGGNQGNMRSKDEHVRQGAGTLRREFKTSA